MACHPMFTQQCPLLQSQSGYCQYTRGLLSMFEFCMFAKRVVHVVTLDGSHNSCSFHWSCYTVHHCCQWFDKRVDVCYNVHHYCLQFEKELFRVVVVGYDIHYCFFMECFVLWLVMLSIITVCCFPFDFCQRRSSCSCGLLFCPPLLSDVCQSCGSCSCDLVYCSLLVLDV